MPWNMQDYPVSMKNLEPLTRKKPLRSEMLYYPITIQKNGRFQLLSVKLKNGSAMRHRKNDKPLQRKKIREKQIRMITTLKVHDYWMLLS